VTFPILLRGLRQRVLGPILKKELQSFRFPLPMPRRIALLEASFQTRPNVRRFDVKDMPWLRAWAPDALVLPLNLALSLADQKLRGFSDLPSLNTAIVVLTTIKDSPLADHHRDLLWSAFGIPVFEQLCGLDGVVIASECEVHDGLHFSDNEPFRLNGEVVIDHCACGLETPRLLRRGPVRLKSALAIAGN
jgi:hypothetical protein